MSEKQLYTNSARYHISSSNKIRNLALDHDLLSDRPPVLSSNSGAAGSLESVAAVTLSLENCSCSQATYSIITSKLAITQ